MNLYTISEKGRIETKIKKSRFIATILPVPSFEIAKEKIEEIRTEFKNATHNPYALRIGHKEIEERYSDDGEPPKSAGFPILQELKKANLTDTLLVVTRYFGGIKLGLGGLNKAYRECALLVINTVDKQRYIALVRYKLIFDSTLCGKIRNIIEHYNAEIIAEEYSNQSVYVIETEEEQKEKFIGTLKNITKGAIKIKKL